MPVKQVKAKSILRAHKKIDSWFLSRYGMNLYRGCAHNCSYCDGRDEKYQVEGEFGCDVSVKTNALALLKDELDQSRKRIPLRPGFMMLGGGVGDAYQPAEERFELTRKVLLFLLETGWPVHVLTKSALVLRDIEILKQINKKKRAVVSFSFSSMDEEISSKMEPGVSGPEERLRAMKKLKDAGIPCGMYLMPVIPFVTDTPDQLTRSLMSAAETADFICFAGMTLKSGRQREHFMGVMDTHFPQQSPGYYQIYTGGKYGGACAEYYGMLTRMFFDISRKFKIPLRMPLRIFSDVVDDSDRVVAILEHIDYLLKLKGKSGPYGGAAYSLSGLRVPIASVRNELKNMQGIGDVTEKLILEILDTGTCRYYEQIISPGRRV